MTDADKIFKGCLLHVNVKGLVDPTIAKLPEARPISEARMAEKLAGFLAKHFLKTTEQPDGSLALDISLTLMVTEAPPGVAHTKILFKEA